MAFPHHTAAAILTLTGLLAAAHGLYPEFAGPRTSLFSSLVEFTPERTPLVPLIRRTPPEAVPAARPIVASRLLEDSGGVLDAFYASLLGTEQGRNVTRIVHFGDSPTTADLVTGDIRSLLQSRFGNSGSGFTLIAKPWAWYQHSHVSIQAEGWQIQPAANSIGADGLFGLGGVNFSSESTAASTITFDQGGQSRFEIWYLRQPGGGSLAISNGGAPLAVVETAGSQAPGFYRLQTPAGVHELVLRAAGGPVRVFGVTAEQPHPGIVYDSLGLNGASITVLSHSFNERHLAAELQHRDPALVIVNYGTNESGFPNFVGPWLEKELREAIRRVRTALPETSILVMSPMDRAQRAGLSEIQTLPTIPRIVAIQQRVAKDTGCAFFNTFEAMGGAGTMARWYEANPRLVSADFIHPTPQGGKIVATLFTRELLIGLNRYKMRQLASRHGSDGALVH